jgi:hypothetical protein
MQKTMATLAARTDLPRFEMLNHQPVAASEFALRVNVQEGRPKDKILADCSTTRRFLMLDFLVGVPRSSSDEVNGNAMPRRD